MSDYCLMQNDSVLLKTPKVSNDLFYGIDFFKNITLLIK